MEQSQGNKKKDESVRKAEVLAIKKTIYGIAVLVFLCWILYLLLLINYDNATRGTFGDMFGGLNALFAGLAFVGVIYAVLLQTKELEFQREDLDLSRSVIEEQRDAQKDQVGIMKAQLDRMGIQVSAMTQQSRIMVHQQIDNTFFKYLQFYYINLENTSITLGGRSYTGRSIFSYMVNENAGHHYKNSFSDLQGYFIYIAEWINFIAEIDPERVRHKDTYRKILMSNLTRNERILLYHHYMNDEAFKKLVDSVGISFG